MVVVLLLYCCAVFLCTCARSASACSLMYIEIMGATKIHFHFNQILVHSFLLTPREIHIYDIYNKSKSESMTRTMVSVLSYFEVLRV